MVADKPVSDKPKRMSFKEKQEWAKLEEELPRLEEEKKEITEKLSSGMCSMEEITALSQRFETLNEEIDEKTMRWLELSELA